MKYNENFYSKILFLFFALSFLYLATFIVFADFRNLIFVIPDDASYYLKIAKNFNAEEGFTFDGINQTNGFHPLWLYLLIPVLALSDENPENTLRIVLFLQLILITISAFIYYKILAIFFEKKIILTSGIIFIFYIYFPSVNGMETSLLVLLLLILFLLRIKLNKNQNKNSKSEIIFGLILGLIILTRLDMILLAIAIGLFYLFGIFSNNTYRNDFTINLRNIILGTLIILLPYLFYNYFSFGNIIPISGYLKSTFPVITPNDKFKDIIRLREILFAVTGLIYLVWFIFSYRKIKSGSDKFFYIAMAVFATGNIFLFIYMLFFLNWFVFSWYFIPYFLFVSLVICIPLEYILHLKKSNFGKNLFGIITLIIFLYCIIKTFIVIQSYYNSNEKNWNTESYEASLWAKNNTEQNEIFAMKDAGNFSLFSERKVINLDGLVNNFEYQEILKNKKLNEHLKNNNVKYIVQHAIWDREDITNGNYDTVSIKYVSHKYSVESDPIILTKNNEVYRSAPYYDGLHRVSFIIWKLNPKYD